MTSAVIIVFLLLLLIHLDGQGRLEAVWETAFKS